MEFKILSSAIITLEQIKVYSSILMPFLATTLGSAFVFVLKRRPDKKLSIIINSLAAGLMVASSIFGLLVPALEGESISSKLSAIFGFMLGYLIILISESLISRVKSKSRGLVAITMLIHNIPEGIAVGMVFLGYLQGSAGITFNVAFVLTLGIALQNIPEGAIISIPEHSKGSSKFKSFMQGVLSGAIEPVFSFLTLCGAGILLSFYPFTLSFASGAMIYAVIEELIPEIYSDESVGKTLPSILFLVGFALMLSAECLI